MCGNAAPALNNCHNSDFAGEQGRCPEGSGTDSLFKIKHGEGFLCVMTALILFSSTGYTINTLKRGTTTELNFGALLAVNGFCAVLAVMVGFNEGSYGLMLHTFNCDENVFFWVASGAPDTSNPTQPSPFLSWEKLECAEHGQVFLALMVIGIMISITQTFIALALFNSKNDFIDGSSLISGGSVRTGKNGGYGELEGDRGQNPGLYSNPPTADL